MTLMITKLVSVQQYDCKNEARLSEIPAVQNDLQRLGNRTHDAIKPGRVGFGLSLQSFSDPSKIVQIQLS